MSTPAVKILVFIKRKDGMSHAEFRDYYENNHAKLARRVFPMIGEYRRNFVDFDGATNAGAGGAAGTSDWADFDVVTELSFDTQADYDAFVARSKTEEARTLIREDELKFLKPQEIRRLRVTLAESARAA